MVRVMGHMSSSGSASCEICVPGVGRPVSRNARFRPPMRHVLRRFAIGTWPLAARRVTTALGCFTDKIKNHPDESLGS